MLVLGKLAGYLSPTVFRHFFRLLCTGTHRNEKSLLARWSSKKEDEEESHEKPIKM